MGFLTFVNMFMNSLKEHVCDGVRLTNSASEIVAFLNASFLKHHNISVEFKEPTQETVHKL
jgi:hypothetical protein